MNADPFVQLKLLDLQHTDTTLAQLAHRRSRLPELAELAEIAQTFQQLDDDLVAVRTEASDLDREQKRLERDIDQVRQRADRDRGRLGSGAVPAKELASLQHEVETLGRRQRVLEDEELEIMQRREDIDGRVTARTAETEEIAARRSAVEEKRDAEFTAIDEQVARHEADRRPIVAQIPADLLALYDRIRTPAAGVGAAALRHRRCEGCRIEFAGAELATIRAAKPDAVLRCDNCRRILVRTADSGL